MNKTMDILGWEVDVQAPEGWTFRTERSSHGVFLFFKRIDEGLVYGLDFHTDPRDTSILQVSHLTRETEIRVGGEIVPMSVSFWIADEHSTKMPTVKLLHNPPSLPEVVIERT